MLVGARWSSPTASGPASTAPPRAADLPDVIVRFDPQPASRVAAADRRAARPRPRYSLRERVTGVGLATASDIGRQRRRSRWSAPGRRGYAIVAGRDVSRAPRRGRDRARARAGLGRCSSATRCGSTASAPLPIVGLRRARPTTSPIRSPTPRVYVSRPALARRSGAASPRVNLAQIWLRDPRQPRRGAGPGARRPATACAGCGSSRARACGCCSTRRRGS